MLLNDIDDLENIKHLVSSKNQILDIKRCIIQVAEKERINRVASTNYSNELILESLVIKYNEVKQSTTSFRSFIAQASYDYSLQHNFDLQTKEQNLSCLVEKVGWLNNRRIPNIQRERAQVDWLYKTNVYLANFIKDPLFEDLIIWKFEDECRYIHLELIDPKDGKEATYWK